MTNAHPRSGGPLLRDLHAGAWRADAATVDITMSELLTVLFPLIESGSVGLVWPRLRQRASCYGAAGAAMADAYVTHCSAIDERAMQIASIVSTFRAAGIEPVLLKGWSLSRLYPAPALRSPGDIDLWVPAVQFATAKAVMRVNELDPVLGLLDLHDDPHWPDPEHVDFRDRAEIVRAAGVNVLVPCPEDHLRLLCLHFVGHFMVRPLWLCDIALLLETRPPDFDWDRLLGRRSPQRGWIITTLSLAHHLLGARVEDTPIAAQLMKPLPRWLMPAVLARWESQGAAPGPVRDEIAAYGVIAAFRRRWPDPIVVTVQYNAPFRNSLALPLQSWSYVTRIVTYSIGKGGSRAFRHLAGAWRRGGVRSRALR